MYKEEISLLEDNEVNLHLTTTKKIIMFEIKTIAIRSPTKNATRWKENRATISHIWAYDVYVLMSRRKKDTESRLKILAMGLVEDMLRILSSIPRRDNNFNMMKGINMDSINFKYYW